jgi:hypothetical protein
VLREQFKEIQSEWDEGVHYRRYIVQRADKRCSGSSLRRFRVSGVHGFMTEDTLVQRAGSSFRRFKDGHDETQVAGRRTEGAGEQ